MATTHTPGPWLQYEDDPLVITDEKGASLGEMVPGDPYISHDEALANARLVAAAPGMLAALEGARNGWEALPGGKNYHPRDVERWLIEHMKPAIDAVRSCLARAKHTGAGESPEQR